MREQDDNEYSRRLWLVAGVVLMLGVAVTLLANYVVPGIITAAYAGRGFSAANRFFASRQNQPLEYYLQLWRNAANSALLVWIGFALLMPVVGSQRFFRKFVGTADASQLGAIRVLVCGVVLMNLLWVNLASTTLLPHSMREPMGLFHAAQSLPGFSRFEASVAALRMFQIVLLLVTAAAMTGWRTRWTVPLACIGYFLEGGLLRQYSHFYHSGMASMDLLAVLSFTPCGDGFSIDARGKPPRARSRTYGWARYACWVTLAMIYFSAGLSKLRTGGLQWSGASNLRAITLTDTLNPMQYDFKLSLQFAHAPDWVFVALGIGTIAIEILYPAVLFSRVARRIFPIAAVAMHVGIWLLQNVLFYDLILLQLIFLIRPAREVGEDEARARAAPLLVCVLAGIMMLVWAYKVEIYPFTAWQMYAMPSSDSSVTYYKLLERHRSGAWETSHPERTIGALKDAFYRRQLAMIFEPSTATRAAEFFQTYANVHNRSAPDPIVAIEVQKWIWHPRDASEPLGGVMVGKQTVATDISGGRRAGGSSTRGR
ncbi:MAG: HTTM domain-containing protein [Acidobacteria bacterium]|nr:HTTM domain-containing protein [Acidobacteriota bacterium]